MVAEKVPAILGAMLNVMAELEVANDGQLPGNMGGKGYRTAEGITNEVKALLVKYKVIAIPVANDTVLTVNDIGNRAVISTRMIGHWDLISVEDGSKVTITGAGDGLAINTSVASNISSTNALKNALRLTLLVTDQSAEDSGMKGVETSSPAQAKVNAAKAPVAARPPVNSAVRDKIKTEFLDTGKATKEQANDLKVKAEADGLKGDAVWDFVYAELRK